MICHGCLTPFPASRYGVTETLCPDCIDAWDEELRERAREVRRDAAELFPECGATFELLSGETVTPCRLPLGHDGDHKGTCLGSVCHWAKGTTSEEPWKSRWE